MDHWFRLGFLPQSSYLSQKLFEVGALRILPMRKLTFREVKRYAQDRTAVLEQGSEVQLLESLSCSAVLTTVARWRREAAACPASLDATLAGG